MTNLNMESLADLWHRKYYRQLLIVLFVLAAVTRLFFASRATFPGHADYAFYYTVAENVAEGRGLVTDYIWNFFANPETVTHPANDYWLPMASLIMAGSMALLGKSLTAALLPSIIFGLLLAGITYRLARRYSESSFIRVTSTLIVLFLPWLFRSSLATDTTIYFAVIVGGAFLAMMMAQENKWFFLVAAVFAAVAHWTRQDAVFLLLTLLLALIASPHRTRQKIGLAAGCLGVYAVLMVPLWVHNVGAFGKPFVGGLYKTLFFTSHDDLYVYSGKLSFASYLDWGLGNIVISKVKAAVNQVRDVHYSLGSFLFVMAVCGVVLELFLWRDSARRRWLLVPVTFGIVLSLFYALLATFPGGGAFMHSFISLLPVLVIVAVGTVERLVDSSIVRTLIILVLGVMLMVSSIYSTRTMHQRNAAVGSEMAALGELITADMVNYKAGGPLIMTCDPWELNHATGYKALRIPNEELPTILEVARHYEANYIVLPAPGLVPAGIYNGTAQDQRFQLVGQVPGSGLRLFRLAP